MGTPARLKLSAQESLLRAYTSWSKIDSPACSVIEIVSQLYCDTGDCTGQSPRLRCRLIRQFLAFGWPASVKLPSHSGGYS